MASPRPANTMLRMRFARVDAYCDPSLLVALYLVLQKDVVPGQHIFGVEAGDMVLGQMPLVVLVPVKFGEVLHCQ